VTNFSDNRFQNVFVLRHVILFPFAFRVFVPQNFSISKWQGVNEEDFEDIMKEISYVYSKEEIWNAYRTLPSQYRYLQLNAKNRSWRVERVEI
jgi:hypothetical protein